MQQVQRGRNAQSLFLLLFCLNGTFYSNENIKVTPQRMQNCAVEILNPEFWPSRTPCLQGSDSWKKLHRGSTHWVRKETFPGSFLYSLLEAYQNNLAVHTLLYSPSKHRTRSAHFPSFSESSGWGKKSKWAKLFVLNYAFILHRLKRRGCLTAHALCISGKTTNQKLAFHLWSGKSCTSVCAHVRNREKDSNHLMNCVN